MAEVNSGRDASGVVVVAIDDSPSALEVISTVTEPEGYTLLTAEDGRSGLELVRRVHPDIVLCDVMMPHMDGFEVCRQLREDTGTWMIPVVLVTALDGKQDRLEGLQAGCDDFVTKPIDRLLLKARIRSLVRIKRLTGLLQDALGRYVAQDIASSLLTNPAAADLGGQRAVVTTLMMDIADFTSFSEEEPVETVVGQLNECFSAMEAVVSEHGGVLDKFIGDALMARFTDGADGIGLAAVQAVASALAMRKEMRMLAASWQARGMRALEIRVCVATGTCIVGNIGSRRRMQYTAIGDSVNTASRLQGVAKRLGLGIAMAGATRDLVGDRFAIRGHGEISLPGKSTPVRLYEVVEPGA